MKFTVECSVCKRPIEIDLRDVVELSNVKSISDRIVCNPCSESFVNSILISSGQGPGEFK